MGFRTSARLVGVRGLLRCGICYGHLSLFRSIPIFITSLYAPSPLRFRTAFSLQESKPVDANLISEFLIADCGLSDSELSVIRKRYPPLGRATSIHKARESVQFLRSYGFSDSQLRKLLFHNPSVLRGKESLRERFDLMKSLGFTEEDIADVVSRGPLTVDVQDIQGIVQFLQSVLGDAENVLKAVKKCPRVLTCDPVRAEKQMECLRKSGLTNQAILSLVSRSPIILTVNSEITISMIGYLRELGVSDGSKSFVTALTCMARGGKDLQKKEEALAHAGLSEEEIREIFRKCPTVISKSSEKIGKVVEYLVNGAGLSADVLLRYPDLLGFSLEKRIRPRHKAFEFLSASGGFRKIKSLGYFIRLSEKKFLERFVEGNPDAPQLLRIYRAASQDPE